MSLNYIVLSGTLAQDGEIRYTAAGNSILEFNLMTPAPTDRKDPNFIRVVSRREYGHEMVHRLKKGISVVVEGQLLNRNYTTRAGLHKRSVEISLENLNIIGEERKENHGQK